MTRNKSSLLLAAFCVVFFIAIAPVFASYPCTVTDPEGAIWYNKNNKVDITCTCPPGTTQLQNPVIAKDYETLVDFIGVDTTWTYTMDIDDRYDPVIYGTYNITGKCMNANYTVIGSFSGSFDVHYLSGYIASPHQSAPLEAYLTDSLSVEYKLFKDGDIVTMDSLAQFGGTLNFEVYLNNEGTTDKKIADTNSVSYLTYDSVKQSWIIPSYKLDSVSGLSSENTYNLKLSLAYNELSSSTILLNNVQNNAVITSKSLVVSLVPGTLPSIIDLTDSTKKDIKLRVIYQGEPAENLDITHFEVYLEKEDGERATLNMIDEDGFTFNEGDGYYVIPVNILQEDPGNYDLKISVWYPGVGEVIIKAAEVRFVLGFNGQIVDANGNVVSARIVLKNNQTEIPFSTDSAGRYSVPITADTYDIAMQFPEVWRVEVKGVDINSNVIDAINYDYFAGNSDIEGMTVAKLVVIEFGLSFDSAYLEIPYSDATIDNEKNIETYECTYWNFGKRKCIGEWVEVSSVVNIVRDLVSFETKRLSAFVIGERRGLWLDAMLDKKDFYANEKITLNGKVIDTKSNEVEGVEVHYVVEGTDITGKVTSKAGGLFSATLSAPDKEGTYSIIATTEKKPYVSYNMTYSFDVTRKKEVRLQVPETVDVPLEESTTVKITIFNTGQTELTNIRLSIAGLKDTWYVLDNNILESIPAGERQTVDLNINIPLEDCRNNDCKKYYFVDVDFKSNQIVEKIAFTAKIKRNDTSADDASPPKEEESSFNVAMPNITGFFSLQTAGKTNMYLSFFFVAFAFVIITIKKKQKRTGGSFRSSYAARGSATASINAIKSRFSRKR